MLALELTLELTLGEALSGQNYFDVDVCVDIFFADCFFSLKLTLALSLSLRCRCVCAKTAL